MRIDIITLFPAMFEPVFGSSILKIAQNKNLVEIHLHDLRQAASDKHRTVDDSPFGGGNGMLLKVDVYDRMLERVIDQGHKANLTSPQRILLSPQGNRFNSDKARELSSRPWLILMTGHYEGFDERIRRYLCDEQISIGDFVLTGGELPAMVICDAVSRFIPGVLTEGAVDSESHQLTLNGNPALEYPQYTRPAEYRSWSVPKILLSGNHAEIRDWQEKQLKKTNE